MRFFSNRKLSRKTLSDIRKRLEKGETLNSEDLVSQYFKPKSPFTYLIAKRKSVEWLCLLTARYNREGKLFGRLNENGKYGFPKNKEEARIITVRGYIRTKGVYTNSLRKITNGVRERLLEAHSEDLPFLKPNGKRVLIA